MRKQVNAFTALVLLLSSLALPAQQDNDATAILEAARVNPLGNKIALSARLRNEAGTTPFRIVVDGAVRYEFDNPQQALILELDEKESRLSEQKGGKTSPVRPARFDEAVRGTGLSYEDLSLKFLYWKWPKIIGEETVRTRRTWKIEVQAPRGTSQYGVARLWIDKESGALLRVEGYNMQGRMVRRFEVVSAQKLDGQWMLKNMRIETLDPETGKTKSRTYLDVLGKISEEPPVPAAN